MPARHRAGARQAAQHGLWQRGAPALRNSSCVEFCRLPFGKPKRRASASAGRAASSVTNCGVATWAGAALGAQLRLAAVCCGRGSTPFDGNTYARAGMTNGIATAQPTTLPLLPACSVAARRRCQHTRGVGSHNQAQLGSGRKLPSVLANVREPSCKGQSVHSALRAVARCGGASSSCAAGGGSCGRQARCNAGCPDVECSPGENLCTVEF